MTKPLPGMKDRHVAKAYIPTFVEFGGLHPGDAVVVDGSETQRRRIGPIGG